MADVKGGVAGLTMAGATILELNDIQAGVLEIAFKLVDDEGLLGSITGDSRRR